MKAAAFDYVKPTSVEQVVSILRERGDDARVLAGGQTLMATLNMRLSEPALIVDITGLDSLRGISVESGQLRIGALVTHAEIEHSDVVKTHAPLLHVAAPHIAHRAIRNSGTWGGSIAYADPAAEWPTCLLALNGTVVVQGPEGERRIAADDFFLGLYTTALEPDEIVVSCEIPVADSHQWFGFDELARRHGDYAIVGMAATALHRQRTLHQPRIVFLGVDSVPFRAAKTEAILHGKTIDEALILSAVASLREELDPLPDLTNTAETKRHLASVLLRRVLTTALTA